jgi:malate synthase
MVQSGLKDTVESADAALWHHLHQPWQMVSVYALKEKTATPFVRPRGWCISMKPVTVNARVSGSIFDFALFVSQCKHSLGKKRNGPLLLLAQVGVALLEAALWNDVFVAAQVWVSPIGTIRATVLWKRLRLLSKWKKLYQLRDHLLGLNCGRLDYLFSFIKKVQDAT